MTVRLLLIGPPGGAFRLAAEMARDTGADVMTADSCDGALATLRAVGADLAMIDVASPVASFIAALRLERFSLPVLACGIDAPAERAVAAIRAGAVDYLPLPPQRELIAAAIAAIVEQPSPHPIGADPGFVRSTAFALAMARAKTPMLLAGESGTGKETLARAIHDASGRAGPFLTVDGDGAAAEVIASELFGHEPGAFPGAAARRMGKLEMAAGGTLFLRAADRLDGSVQARLADALRSGTTQRLGEGAPIAVDTRIIAATGADLDALVAAGAYRADLAARLSFVRVELPPLRRRQHDIPLLAAHFAERLASANGVAVRPLDDGALALLQCYDWPGNVRELEDVIHRAVLLETGARLGAAALVLVDGTRLDSRPTRAGADVSGLVGMTVEDVERDLILKTLERCRGNRTSASTILGISVRTMRNKLRSFIEAGIVVAQA